MGGMMERERGWGGAYGRVLSLCAGRRIEQRKKYNNKICCGLRWPCYNIPHATTNNKRVVAMERVYRSRCNQGIVSLKLNSLLEPFYGTYINSRYIESCVGN
jgi:hypothetical protein